MRADCAPICAYVVRQLCIHFAAFCAASCAESGVFVVPARQFVGVRRKPSEPVIRGARTV